MRFYGWWKDQEFVFDDGYAYENAKRAWEFALAASQAREKMLRDALEKQPRTFRTVWKDGIDLDLPDAVTQIRDEALAQLTDDTELNKLLSEGQAREKMLCDALFELANAHVVVYSQSPEGRAYMKKLGDLMASKDDTALRAALEAERERCAKVCESLKRGGESMNPDCWQAGINRAYMSCSDAIHALGD